MDDENTPLAALKAPPSASSARGAGRGRGAKAPRAGDRTKGERPRVIADDEFLRDVVIGYIATEEDPVQSGNPKDRESEEIKRLTKEQGADQVPIAKSMRNHFVWVARAQEAKRHRRKMYTTDVDNIRMVERYQDGRNSCDICGADCTEELYEFRAYKRLHDPEGGERKLHPFVAYISKECGRGLLGVATPNSRFVAQLSEIVASDDAVDRLHTLFQHASPREQLLIQTKLRYIARIEAGENERSAELERAERRFGKIDRAPRDPFRGVARSFSGTISSWDLAAATIHRAKALDKLPSDGWLAEVASALFEGQPLPAAPQSWSKHRAMQGLRLISECWPVRVVVQEMLGADVKFEPSTTAVATVTLVWVCMELHSFEKAAQEVSKDAARSLLKEVRKVDCPERFCFAKQPQTVQTLRGLRGTKAEDAAITIPEGLVEDGIVLQALQSITWPHCFSRANVRPDGAHFISAFPMGIVQNYCSGLMMSVTSRIWPNLARLLNKYVADRYPDFRWTTLQLNRNYSAKLHVDANNLGPSLIIALGEFEEGGLWIMEEGGTEPMTIQEPLRGFQSLKKGTEIYGRVKTVRNTFLWFDGTLPHTAMKYRGKERYSVVYFTRKGWLSSRCDPNAKEKLEALGFVVPGEDYVAKHAPQAFAGAGIQIKKPSEKSSQNASEIDEDDEVDEEERFDSALEMQLAGPVWRGHEWARRFLDKLNLTWDVSSLGSDGHPLTLSTCEVGAVPSLALEQLLPTGMLKQIVMTETRPESIRFAKHNSSPEYIFTDVAAIGKGGGVCEIRHCKVEFPNTTEEIFVGSISLEPFKVHDKHSSKQLNVENDSRSQPFQMQRKQIADRKPCIAILTVSDYGESQKRSEEMSALEFIMKGKVGKDAWGLELLPGYGVELVELEAHRFGIPLAQICAFVVLVRDDCGGAKACQTASRLARDVLSKVLELCPIGELLFEDSDTRLDKVVGRSAAEYLRDPNESKTGTKEILKRRIQAAAKALGGKSHDESYVNYLQGQYGSEFLQKSWVAAATTGQRQCLNLAFAMARLKGMDVENFVIDMSSDVRILQEERWRDDGLLSASRSSAPAVHYSFAKHRPLAGQEELSCRGFPLTRLRLQLPDRSQRQLAATSIPLPVMGAMFCATLASAEIPGRQLGMESKAIEKCLASIPDPGEQSLSTAILSIVAAEKKQRDKNNDDALLEGRAAALLSMMRHGKFGQEEVGVLSTRGRKPKEKELGGILQSLKEVSKEDGAVVEADLQTLALADHRRENALDEPRPWHERLRKIRYGNNPKPEPEAIWRWIHQAAEDSFADNAEAIVKEGIANLCQQLKGGGGTKPMPEACVDNKQEFANAIKEAGFVELARPFFEILDACILEEEFDGSKSLVLQDPTEMAAYIDEVVKPLSLWSSRRCFLQHLAQKLKILSESEKDTPNEKDRDGKRALKGFAEAGGFEIVAAFLREAPDEVDDDWPEAGAYLDTLRLEPLRRYAHQADLVAPAVHHVAGRLSSKATKTNLMGRIEAMLVKDTGQILMLELTPEIVKRVRGHSTIEGQTGQRLRLTVEMLYAALWSQQKENASTDVTAEEWRSKLAMIDPFLSQRPSLRGWDQVAKAEERFMALHRARCHEGVIKATEHEEHHRRMFHLQEAKRKSEQHFDAAKESVSLIKRLCPESSQSSLSDDSVLELRKAKANLQLSMRNIQDERAHSEELRSAMALASEALKAHANRGVNEARSAVMDCIGLEDGRPRLREPTEEGMGYLHGAISKLKQQAAELGPADRVEVEKTIKQALDAARRCAGFPEARAKAAKVLMHHGLAPFVQLLASKGLLTTIGSLRTRGRARLEGSGLPDFIRTKLVNLAVAQGWSDEHFQPHPEGAPPNWERQLSRSSGMHFFHSHVTGESMWMWPDNMQIPPQEQDFQEPPPVEIRGFQKPGTAVYMEYNGAGDGICHLCQEVGSDHFKSAKHKNRKMQWDKLVSFLQASKKDFTSDPHNLGSEEVRGLARAWRFELYRLTSSPEVPAQFNEVKRVFWCRVVRFHAPTVDTSAAIDEAFDKMLEFARMPEPALSADMPKPGKDFAVFPLQTVATCNLSADVPEATVEDFTLSDLLGEGIEKVSEGQFRCGFCEMTFEAARLSHHLHPHYKEAQKHQANQTLVRDVGKKLQSEGWRLEPQLIAISKKQYSCQVCKKTAPWYEFPDHMTTKHHKANCPTQSSTKEEEEEMRSGWVTEMTALIDDHLSGKVAVARAEDSIAAKRKRERLAAAEREAVAAAKKRTSEMEDSPPKRARPTVPQPASPVMPAPPEPEPEVPVLPVPGKDFLWLRKGDDGMTKKDGRDYCSLCEESVPNAQDHLSSSKHKKYLTYFEHFMGVLREHGWLFRREGIKIKDGLYHCEPCRIQKKWYDLPENHWTSKNHVKYRRQAIGDLPAEKADDPERLAWKDMLEELDKPPEPRASSSSAPSPKQSRDPSPKRPRVDAEPGTTRGGPTLPESSSLYYESSATASSSSSATQQRAAPTQVEARPPPGAAGYRHQPSQDDIKFATTKAGNLYIPPLPVPSLVFGYYKKPWMWVHCQECKEWVALVRFNFSEGLASTEDGECVHYTPQVAEKFRGDMLDVIKRWGR